MDFWANLRDLLAKSLIELGTTAIAQAMKQLWQREKAEPGPTQEMGDRFSALPPLPLTELVGREAEMADVIRLLTEHRLVTLTGLGGVGKTALAQVIARWAWEEDETPPRGTPFVKLDALAGGRALADTLRRELVPDYRPPAEADEAVQQASMAYALAAALRREARLLVLDNFETALDAGGATWSLNLLREVLERAEGVRCLVTSRRQLGLPFEEVYEVEPLEEDPAVLLFLEQAGPEPRAEQRPLIAEICERVDRLPLGIELMALQVRRGHRPLREILEGLRITPLDEAAAKYLGYPPRQRGLMACFRYNYERLSSDDARRIFCSFAVFRGGADRAAMAAVHGEGWEAALAALVDWSLVRAHPWDETFRYDMLPTVAAYAAWQLREGAQELGLDEGALCRRHTEHYLRTAEALNAEFAGENVVHIGKRMDLELENLRAGMDWAWQQQKWELVKGYARALVNYFELRDLWAERIEWGERGVEACEQLGQESDMVVLYRQIGKACERTGAYSKALQHYDRGLSLIDQLDTQDLQVEQARLSNDKASTYRLQGEYNKAVELCKQALKVLEGITGNSEKDRADILNTLGVTYWRKGRLHQQKKEQDRAAEYLDKATQELVESLNIMQKIGRQIDIAKLHLNLGIVFGDKGKYQQAITYFRQGLEIAEQIGNARGVAIASHNLGDICRREGDYDKAIEYFERSLTLFQRIGDQELSALTYFNLGQAYESKGEFVEVIEQYRRSQNMWEEIGDERRANEVMDRIEQVRQALERTSGDK